jgi:hypothetical protein
MKRQTLQFLLVVLSTFSAGCIHFAPIGRIGELPEAKALYKTLRDVSGEVRSLLIEEHAAANALKITLDELAERDAPAFRQRFDSYVDRFVAVRDRRRQILQTISHENYGSPLVHVVQQKAMRDFQDEIFRTEGWIRLAQSLRLRAELGRQKDFPEFAALSRQLEGFLSVPIEDSLSPPMAALEEEFRGGGGDVI